MKMIFVLITIIWLFVGFCGVMNCKKDRVHWEMIIFVSVFPFFPIIAKFCGLI